MRLKDLFETGLDFQNEIDILDNNINNILKSLTSFDKKVDLVKLIKIKKNKDINSDLISSFLENNEKNIKNIIKERIIQKIDENMKIFFYDYFFENSILSYNKKESKDNKEIIILKNYTKKLWKHYISINLVFNKKLNETYFIPIVLVSNHGSNDRTKFLKILDYFKKEKQINNFISEDFMSGNWLRKFIEEEDISNFVSEISSNIVETTKTNKEIFIPNTFEFEWYVIKVDKKNYHKIKKLEDLFLELELSKDFKINSDYYENIDIYIEKAIEVTTDINNKLTELLDNKIILDNKEIENIINSVEKTKIEKEELNKIEKELLSIFKYNDNLRLEMYSSIDESNNMFHWLKNIIIKNIFLTKDYITNNHDWNNQLYQLNLILLLISLLFEYILDYNSNNIEQSGFNKWMKENKNKYIAEDVEFLIKLW